MLMNKKQLESYEAPSTNVLELRFEGIICQSLNAEDIAPGTLDDWGIL